MVKPAKPTLRTKSIGTKVTDEEYARIEARAGGQTVGEWIRETVLKAVEAPTAAPATAADAEALMAELSALRTILLNMHYRVANGEKISEPEMRDLIDHADGNKRKRALERLSRPSEDSE